MGIDGPGDFNALNANTAAPDMRLTAITKRSDERTLFDGLRLRGFFIDVVDFGVLRMEAQLLHGS